MRKQSEPLQFGVGWTNKILHSKFATEVFIPEFFYLCVTAHTTRLCVTILPASDSRNTESPAWEMTSGLFAPLQGAIRF